MSRPKPLSRRKSRVSFQSKAGTLEKLRPLLRRAHVLPQVRFTVGEWRKSPRKVLSRVAASGWMNKLLIVRSSARGEDSPGMSLAGRYRTVQKVRGEEALKGAIGNVIASYGRKARSSWEVFVQPQLEAVRLSGVAFGADPNTGSPYLVVNYDDRSGSTSSVTSGEKADAKTFYMCSLGRATAPAALRNVAAMMQELSGLLGTDRLDAEFAVTDRGKLYLLQVRPLTQGARPAGDDGELRRALSGIALRIKDLSKRHPYLYGDRAVFGVMPDWNPAEMIGIRPRPLALSLYKDLVTDSIWAYQRDNYGYRNLRSFPLMVNFCGLPYIDVRVSFNSFIPGNLRPELGEKLANYYMDRLMEHPGEHDKVEFEIVYTCYTLDLPGRMERLRAAGFSSSECDELAVSLRSLTNRIINPKSGLWRQEIERIRILESRIETILSADLDKVAKIYWLLEDCKRYGTLPFSGLARAGFIAVQLLKSLVNVGILDASEYERFMGSLDTVSSRMTRDFGSLPARDFLRRYGHLRPGTYDILSPRYDEEPQRYFDWSSAGKAPARSQGNFRLTEDKAARMEKLLAEHGLEHDVGSFFDFIKIAIEGREFAKFVFSRSLSDSLSLLKRIAAEEGISTEDVSYTDIECVRHLYSSSASPGRILKESVARGRRSYELTKRIILPPLITGPEEVRSFHMPESEPNFITLKSATAPVAFIGDSPRTFRGKILLIPSADPGYDWVFSHGIAGLVTTYGGANSHMAIRSGELGIPGVIGAGEVLYRKWAMARMLEVDCANRRVRVLK